MVRQTDRRCNSSARIPTVRHARRCTGRVWRHLTSVPRPQQLVVIRAFGSLAIEDGAGTLGPRDLGGARPKHVLQILLAARGRPVPTDRIAHLLWGDDLPRNASGSLQTFVSVLRRRLSVDRERARLLIATESEAYRLSGDLIDLDLDRFDLLLERSAHQSTRAARASLEEALSLVRGEVFEDEPYATWALDLRASYQGRILGAHLDAAEAALAELAFNAALAHAEAAALLDGFSERARRTEMLSLYALGRSHEALGRYRDFRMRLSEDLGLDPSAESRVLEAAILRQDDVRAFLPRPLRRESRDTGDHRIRLLGRATELGALEHAIDRGLRGGTVVVLIEGDTGLGKTRMLDEAERMLADVRVGSARCSQLEAHLPYVPLAAALRRALGDVAVETGQFPALCRVLPELAVNSQRLAHDDLDVLEDLVALVAMHAPMGLLIDDLQWADGATLAAISYLRRRASAAPLLIIITAMPNAAGAARPLPEPDALIHLDPLTEDDIASLGRPHLYETTGGNPRFIADALSGNRSWQRSRSLTDALIAQCRAEGDSSYRILAAASVLEAPFRPERLGALLEMDVGELIEELERLCQRRILRIDGIGFRFRYELVRLVLCEQISPARKRLFDLRLQEVDSESGDGALERVGRERAG
jgi:DNA-binding SARP family transcriptional activator